MIVAFCPIIRTSDGEKKDTLINIEREKECVINFMTEDIIDPVNSCGTELAYGESEFTFSGLTPIDSELVKAPRIKESPIHYEGKLRDIISYGETPGCGSLVTLEVIKVHIKEELLDNGRINTSLYKPVGRGAGNDWILCDNIIQRERKMKAQIQ